MNAARPKIAIVTSSMDGRNAMGTAIFIHKLVTGLVAHKNELDITLIHQEANPNEPLYKEFREIILPHVPTPKFSRPLSELAFYVKCFFTREQFDVYHFAHPFVYPFFFLAPGKKNIITVYDAGALTAGKDLTSTKDKYGPFKWMLLRNLCDTVIATSQFGKDGLCQVRGFDPAKVAIGYGGAEEIFQATEEKAEIQTYLQKQYGIQSPYLVASGRLDPHKNILRLVQAHARLIEKEGKRLPLIVTGGDHTPGYTEEVHAEIKRLGLEDVVRIWKFPSFQDMPKLYRGAELMIYPSLYEGFGLPLVEAMRCGVPTAVARASSLIEVGGDASAFFDPRDPQDMCDTIHRVLHDTHLQQNMIQKGFTQATQFTWTRHAEDMKNLYLKLANS